MSDQSAPSLTTIIYPVDDLARAKTVFTALLGAAPTMDEAYYVQYSLDGQEIGLDPNGAKKGMTGPIGYWHVADLAATRDAVVAAGGSVDQAVQDFGGRLVGTVKDAAGNVIGLIQNG